MWAFVTGFFHLRYCFHKGPMDMDNRVGIDLGGGGAGEGWAMEKLGQL